MDLVNTLYAVAVTKSNSVDEEGSMTHPKFMRKRTFANDPPPLIPSPIHLPSTTSPLLLPCSSPPPPLPPPSHPSLTPPSLHDSWSRRMAKVSLCYRPVPPFDKQPRSFARRRAGPRRVREMRRRFGEFCGAVRSAPLSAGALRQRAERVDERGQSKRTKSIAERKDSLYNCKKTRGVVRTRHHACFGHHACRRVGRSGKSVESRVQSSGTTTSSGIIDDGSSECEPLSRMFIRSRGGIDHELLRASIWCRAAVPARSGTTGRRLAGACRWTSRAEWFRRTWGNFFARFPGVCRPTRVSQG